LYKLQAIESLKTNYSIYLREYFHVEYKLLPKYKYRDCIFIVLKNNNLLRTLSIYIIYVPKDV